MLEIQEQIGSLVKTWVDTQHRQLKYLPWYTLESMWSANGQLWSRDEETTIVNIPLKEIH